MDSSTRRVGTHAPIRIALLIVVVAVGLAAGILWMSSRTASVSNSPAAGQAAVNDEFQKLLGRWVRPDGGYVIDIKDVDESGNMQAAYYNPRSINVAKAQASREDSATRLYIELRDVNYPGSYYALTYDPKTDRLEGSYFQAVARETYEVFFERMK